MNNRWKKKFFGMQPRPVFLFVLFSELHVKYIISKYMQNTQVDINLNITL